MKVYHIVYQTTNLVNGKIYIGKHSTKDLNDGYIGSGHTIKKAIKKYGKENFLCQPLFFAFTSKDAFLIEAELVDSLFIKKINNYNQVVGGIGLGSGEEHPFYGKTHSSVTKQKMREAKIGKTLSADHAAKAREILKQIPKFEKHKEETKLKISESQKGSLNHNFGKELSEETKRKISEKMKTITKFEEITCPYCSKIGRGPVMRRYHFDKCKLAPFHGYLLT